MIYFDNAATTFPKPVCMSAEMQRCIRSYCGNPGRSSHRLSISAAAKIYECRCELAGLFKSEHPENVVFTYNTTYALNLAIKTLIKPGSHVLISDLEHNSVYRPVHALADKKIIQYDIFRSFAGDEQKILADIDLKAKSNTDAVICTHASNICGVVMPVGKIGEFCKRRGITFIVDAAQSAGLLDIDIAGMNIDAICAPGHKGLYGPQGTGVLLVRKGLMPGTFIEGGNGVNSKDPGMPDFLPERLETGTLATPCIAGLCESVKLIRGLTPGSLREKETALSKRAAELLGNTKNVTVYAADCLDTNTLCFNFAGMDSAAIARELDEAGVCVRAGFHCSPLAHATLGTGDDGAVRISFGMYSTEREIERFYKILKRIIGGT